MACGEKAEDTTAQNLAPGRERVQQHRTPAEDSSAKDPDPDRDGICSPWVSQNGVMDKYRDLCDGIDKCPDQAGSGNANGCP